MKTAIVTGASRGIGRQIALRFAREGFGVAVFCSSASSMDEAEKTCFLVRDSGAHARAYVCDVRNSPSVNESVARIISDFGRIDVLVNNAGISKDGLSMRMTDEQFDQVVDTNLKGTFRVIRACLPHMIKARRGNIVNMSSVVGLRGNAGQANYSASKAGIIGLTKSVAREVASRNILVNAVAPGAVDAGMFASLGEKIKEPVIASIPLGRPATADEIADVVYFLATQTCITGQVICADGGMGM